MKSQEIYFTSSKMVGDFINTMKTDFMNTHIYGVKRSCQLKKLLFDNL